MSARPPEPTTAHDVVIVGGGPAGCSTALGLARAGLSVLLVEAGHFQAGRIGESLSPGGRHSLTQLGLWPDFVADAHRPTHGSMSIWGAPRAGHNDFLTSTHGPGWHLDRGRFDAMLLRAMMRAGVRVRLGWRLLAQRHAPDCAAESGWQLDLAARPDKRETLHARHFLVDATGQRALVARRVGARRVETDRMVVRSARFSLPDDDAFPDTTLLEAVRDGWWYAARLPDNSVLAAFTTDAAGHRPDTASRELSWLTRLAATRLIGPQLAAGRLIPHSLESHSALSGRLDASAGADWLAVGDAATSLDPLMAQGIHKALTSGQEAADAIIAARRGDQLAIPRCARTQTALFDDYKAARRYFYRQEMRWPKAGFWRARHAAVNSPAREHA